MAERIISLNGVEHHFPDTFTDDQISSALKSYVASDTPAPKPEPKWYEPGGDVILDNIRSVAAIPGRVARFVSAHPVESGATAGAVAAIPLTGGTSILPMMGAAFLGGAGGAGGGLVVKAARGDADTPNTPGGVVAEMGKQGAIQAATEGGGALASKGAELVARGLYKVALRPAARLVEKYGDLVGAGLNEAAPVGSSRVITGRLRMSKNATTGLAAQAEQAGRSVPTTAVTDQYVPLVDTAAKREALGVPGDINEIAARESAFNAAHPSQQIAPTRALELKREMDNLATTAQNAIRRGNAVNDMTAQLHNATRAGLNEGLDSATQGLTSSEGLNYADQNARTSTLYGLSRALRTAENRPHALTDLASLTTGLVSGMSGGSYGDRAEKGLGTALALRALASPGIQSRAGIAAYTLAGVPYAQLLRAMILARLRGQGGPTPATEAPQSPAAPPAPMR